MDRNHLGGHSRKGIAVLPFIVGVILLVLAYTLLVPYPIYLLLLIGGILALLYGVFVIFRVVGGGTSVVEPTTRRRRWWY